MQATKDFNVLGGMWGDHAVQAPFCLAVTKGDPEEGIARAMVGGVILADIGDEQWQRWRGTAILLPRMIDKTRRKTSMRIDQILADYIGREMSEYEKLPRDSFWVPTWRIRSQK